MKFLTGVLLLLANSAEAQQYGWVRVAQLGNQFTSLNAVEFVDSLHGWTAEATDFIYKTTDGGSSWIGYPGSPMGVNSISMLDTLTGWCVGSQGTFRGKILHTTDGGLTWLSQLERDNRAYYGTSTQTRFKNITSGSTSNFSPDTGKVVRTTNEGVTWDERTIADSIRALTKAQFIDSLHGWIIAGTSNSPAVLRTTDGGQTWMVYVPTPPANQAISFIDTSQGWCISSNPTYAYRTTDAGASWVRLGRVEDPFWGELIPRSISFVDSMNGWAFGIMFYQGDLAAAIFRTTDGGLLWVREFVGGGSRALLDGKMLDRYHGWAVGDFGNVFAYRLSTGVPERLGGIPTAFALRQNYPNPFNSTTSIEYEVQRRSHVTITAYDVSGREVARLVNADHEAGAYRVVFDARNLASGIYYYTMKTPSFAVSKQMTLIK